MAAPAAKKRKVSTSSDSHIHDDIAFSILSKLPLKSLTHFTSAKKSWSLLFQNPNFMNMFRTNFFLSKHDDEDNETRLILKEHSLWFPIQQSLCILSGDKFENRVSLDLPLPFQQDHNANIFPFPFQVADDNDNGFPFTPVIFIVGSTSVNGTICLYQGLTIVLRNPATAEFKILPPSVQPYENIEFNFPPHGFGYDCVTNDYKVIRKVHYPLEFEGGEWVYLPDKDDPFWEIDVHDLDRNDGFWEEKELIVKLYGPFWELYSLKSNSWRKLDGFDHMPISYPGVMSMVNLNGFCHWLTPGPDMVSFDFSKETFVTTTLPSNSDVLGELGVKESWTKLFVVGPFACSIVCPISVGNKNRIFFREEDSELGWLDLSTQRV